MRESAPAAGRRARATAYGSDLVVPGIVVVAATVTWLQTKVDIHFKRVEGKTNFEFRVVKEAANGSTLRELASMVSKLLK